MDIEDCIHYVYARRTGDLGDGPLEKKPEARFVLNDEEFFSLFEKIKERGIFISGPGAHVRLRGNVPEGIGRREDAVGIVDYFLISSKTSSGVAKIWPHTGVLGGGGERISFFAKTRNELDDVARGYGLPTRPVDFTI